MALPAVLPMPQQGGVIKQLTRKIKESFLYTQVYTCPRQMFRTGRMIPTCADSCQEDKVNTGCQEAFLYLGVILFYHSTTLIHPSGALIRPIWMPVRVSYSFWVISPIFSIPLGMQISLP